MQVLALSHLQLADVYLLRGYILQVLLHHDLSQTSLDQPFCALSLCWPVHTTQNNATQL